MSVAEGSGALVPGSGEGSTPKPGSVATGEGVLAGAGDGAGAGVAGGGGVAGTVTDGVPGLEAADGGAAVAEATGKGLVVEGGELTVTVGRGPFSAGGAASGTDVQPATQRLNARQAAAIAVVLLDPRPACMTARAPVRPPVIPTLGPGNGEQHAARVTVRTRVGHARPARTQKPPPAKLRSGGAASKRTRLLLLLRPGLRSGARRCP